VAVAIAAVRPQIAFSGKIGRGCSDAIVKSFDRLIQFIRCTEMADNSKQLNLLTLLSEDAADWLESMAKQSGPSTVEDIVNVGRIAELTMPRVASMGDGQSGRKTDRGTEGRRASCDGSGQQSHDDQDTGTFTRTAR